MRALLERDFRPHVEARAGAAPALAPVAVAAAHLRRPLRPVAADAPALDAAHAFLAELVEAAGRHAFDASTTLVRDVRALEPRAQDLVDEALGEGEVAALVEEPVIRLHETAFPGFWRVRRFDDAGRLVADDVEVGPVPGVLAESALLGSRCRLPRREPRPEAPHAPALLAELVAASARGEGAPAHVVNLTLLPVSAEDVAWLVDALGVGPVTLFASGFGNCRVTSTGLRHAWWVQYCDARNAPILDTLEIAPVPEAALATAEDLADSLARLREWLGTLE